MFYFTIPYTEPLVHTQSEPKNDSVKDPSLKPLILLAEDDDTNYQYLEVFLKKSGCDFLYAINGEEAVKLCKENPGITFVLMDIKMPVMNGLEATMAIREFMPDLPVIALTAYAQTGDEQRILAAGCDAYYPKPIHPEVLMKLIRKYSL